MEHAIHTYIYRSFEEDPQLQEYEREISKIIQLEPRNTMRTLDDVQKEVRLKISVELTITGKR